MFDSIPNNIVSKVTGKLLGDGCLIKQKGRKPRFQYMHSISDKDWALTCYNQLKDDLPISTPSYIVKLWIIVLRKDSQNVLKLKFN